MPPISPLMKRGDIGAWPPWKFASDGPGVGYTWDFWDTLYWFPREAGAMEVSGVIRSIRTHPKSRQSPGAQMFYGDFGKFALFHM